MRFNCEQLTFTLRAFMRLLKSKIVFVRKLLLFIFLKNFIREIQSGENLRNSLIRQYSPKRYDIATWLFF